jgi:hypothetical protein
VLLLALAASPAGALVVSAGGRTYGVTPINGKASPKTSGAVSPGAPRRSGTRAVRPYDGPPGGGGPLINHGGPVMHSVTSHIVYWDPNGEFTATTKALIGKFFTDVVHDSGLPSNVFAVAGQYKDASGYAAYNASYAGELVDKTAYPASGCTAPTEFDKGPPYTNCLTDTQVQEELEALVAANELPHGPTDQYFMLFPHRVVTCFDQTAKEIAEKLTPECSSNVFCAYHGATEESGIIYSDIPFSLLDEQEEHAKGCQDDGNAVIQTPNGDRAGTDKDTRYGDVALKYISHEYIEAATDPLLNAWFDANGYEIADKCNGVHGAPNGVAWDPKSFIPTLGGSAEAGTLFNQSINTGSYYLQSEWDNGAKACTMKPAGPGSVAFTPTPASPVVGAPVTFAGSAVAPYGTPSFSWAFGDGETATGSSPTHSYAAAGSYQVTLTARDELLGSTTVLTKTVAVANPVGPAPVISAPVAAIAAVPPSSAFTSAAPTFNPLTGVISFSISVADPGTLRWLVTFQNGKFGVFAASNQRCRSGFVRLAGRCRPSKIVFAKGSRVVLAPGAVTIRLKPSASALKALRNALKRRTGLPVTMRLTFQSSRGAPAVSRNRSMIVKLKRK